MKRKTCAVILAMILLTVTLSGCEQTIAKNYGGDMTIDLPPGEKLETIPWKDDSLWYLTRPMREGETAETHVFKQSTSMGVFEGTVTVVEYEEGE